MAQSTTYAEPTLHDSRHHSARSNSLVSTASSGGASLRRKSRTRTRTLTSVQRGKSVGQQDGAGDGGLIPQAISDGVEAPVPSLSAHSKAVPNTSGVAQRPPSSAKASTSTPETAMKRANASEHPRDVSEPSRGRQAKSEGGSVRGTRKSLRCASLPRHAFKTSMSSDSSAHPSPLTPDGEFYNLPAIQVALQERAKARDSILSHHSVTSSSLYPASTSSSSQAESSLLPYSQDGDTDRELDRVFGPTIVTSNSNEFDPDDVSYRLRLLVNNSYFLPPAHAKPSPLSLNPPNLNPAKKAQKTTNATFLDFFRIGKSKSRPTTPGAPSPLANDATEGPILRTTSDSTTASGHVQRPHARSLPQAPLHPAPPPPQTVPTRVVVLRERMDDLVVAAKEAENDLKSRVDGRKAQNNAETSCFVDDVIDPTDAVDLPPPSAGYPFAVQASAAYGLGVRDSVGAALLADQLPPPNSPGDWSLNSEEDAWRKALLSEAVSHSLNSSTSMEFTSSSVDQYGVPFSPMSPDSFQSSHASSSSALSSPSASSVSVSFMEEAEEQSNPPQHSSKRLIGQPILPDLRIESPPETRKQPSTPKESQTLALPGTPAVPSAGFSPSKSAKWNTDVTPPSRAETPPETYSLAPPPRRQLFNPLYSLSQPDLPDVVNRDSSRDSSSDPSHVVRRVVSSPKLSALREPASRSQLSVLSFTPPPSSIEQRISPYSGENTGPSRATLSTASMSEDDEMSYATPMETDSERPEPRQSISISISGGRPSFTDELQRSPTASAFQDALFGSCRSPSVLSRRSFTSDFVPSRSPSPLPPMPSTRSRSHTVVSPPPRCSTSLAPTILPPPPRSRVSKPVYRPSLSSKASSEAPRRSFTPSTPPVDTTLGPSSAAAVPLAERRGRTSTLSLHIPNEGIAPAIHSAPAPASPTDFFDRIQAQHNAMDDLETSDESDEEDDSQQEPATIYVDSRSQAVSNRASSSSSRPSIMRLGNFSTPQLAPSPSMAEPPVPVPSFDLQDRRPVGNVPFRNEFFTSRKKGIMNTAIPTLEVTSPPASPPREREREGRARTTSMRSPSTKRRRPATASEADSRGAGRARQGQRESLLRFDDLLLQHMESERVTIKRIASSIASSQS